MEQLKYAEMRARQQHFQQIQHQQHSQAGAPHSNQAASGPPPQGPTAGQQATSTPAPQAAPSPATPASSAPAPESQPPPGAHTSPPCPPSQALPTHSSSSTTPALQGELNFRAEFCSGCSKTQLFRPGHFMLFFFKWFKGIQSNQ